MKAFFEYFIEYIRRDFHLNVIVEPLGFDDNLMEILDKVSDVFLVDVKAKYNFFLIDNNVDGLIALIKSDCTLIACLLYRIEREIFLLDSSSVLLSHLANMMRTRTGIELYYSTSIGPGLNIQHGTGIVVGPRYCIGENFVIHQGVTLGQRRNANEVINIGDNVSIFAGAKVLGNLNIGNNVKIAANAVLLTDATEYSTYAGMPATKTRSKIEL